MLYSQLLLCISPRECTCKLLTIDQETEHHSSLQSIGCPSQSLCPEGSRRNSQSDRLGLFVCFLVFLHISEITCRRPSSLTLNSFFQPCISEIPPCPWSSLLLCESQLYRDSVASLLLLLVNTLMVSGLGCPEHSDTFISHSIIEGIQGRNSGRN